MVNLRSFFAFTKRTDNLGVGTGNLGFLPPTTLPPNVPYLGNTGERQWNVQRSFGPVNSPGYMLLNQTVVLIGLRGSGLGIAGQYVLQQLSETEG